MAALLSLLISNIGRKPNPTIDRLQLDAFISDDFQRSGKLTAHALEDGSSITDHFIKNPDIVTVSGMVSDSPVLGFPFVGQVFAVAGLFGAGRIKTAREGLSDLWDNPRLVTISTTRQRYVNYVMTNLSIPTNAGTGNKLDFNATFQKASIVQARLRLLTTEEKQNLEDKSEEAKKLKKQLAAEQKAKLAQQPTFARALINAGSKAVGIKIE